MQHSKWSFNRAPSLTSKSTLPAALILGVTTIVDDQSGEEYKVTFQNENLFVEDPNGKVIVTILSIISLLDLSLEGEVRTGPTVRQK